MARTVTVTGDTRAIRMLLAKGRASGRLKPAMEAVADYAERQITGVPVDTGRLAESTRGGDDQLRKVDDASFSLGSQVPYARFVFGGTKHMRARPPRVNVTAIARAGAQRINQELERA